MLALVGESLVAARAGDDEVVAVVVGDVWGEVACPEFEFSFGSVQPRIKVVHKQKKATVKRCCLEFCTQKFILPFRLKPQT
jgi:hypothetical protein